MPAPTPAPTPATIKQLRPAGTREAARRVRRWALRGAKALPPPRDAAALALLRDAKALVTGRTAPAPPPPAAPRGTDLLDRGKRGGGGRGGVEAPDRVDGPPLPRVAHLRDEKLWADPPPAAGVGRTVRALPVPDRPRQVFDLALFEQLNAEYADRPLVPSPPTYTHDSLTAAARRRVGWVHRMVDLAGTRCLEIGCGNGYEVWYAANALGAQAHGVDVREYGTWETLRAHGARLELADLAVASPYTDGSFDRLLSFTVWEHVLHPYAMLAAAHRLLRPGGLFWLRANLYAGPQASHRYRDVYFPWPHLLFSDDVADEFFRSRGRPQVGWAWVNRLSWLHYRHYLDRLGFRVRHLQFWETPIDEPFYARFEDVLGRYPRRDLTRDYFLAVLEKPA